MASAFFLAVPYAAFIASLLCHTGGRNGVWRRGIGTGRRVSSVGFFTNHAQNGSENIPRGCNNVAATVTRAVEEAPTALVCLFLIGVQVR